MTWSDEYASRALGPGRPIIFDRKKAHLESCLEIGYLIRAIARSVDQVTLSFVPTQHTNGDDQPSAQSRGGATNLREGLSALHRSEISVISETTGFALPLVETSPSVGATRVEEV